MSVKRNVIQLHVFTVPKLAHPLFIVIRMVVTEVVILKIGILDMNVSQNWFYFYNCFKCWLYCIYQRNILYVYISIETKTVICSRELHVENIKKRSKCNGNIYCCNQSFYLLFSTAKPMRKTDFTLYLYLCITIDYLWWQRVDGKIFK